MDSTPNLGLPYIMAAQAQKHVTHNEAIRVLDAVVQLAVLDRDFSSPPATPSDGDRYLVAASASGTWAGHDGSIAAWLDGAWMFLAPREGWIAWVADERILLAWDGAAWVRVSAGINPATGGKVGINTTADDANRLAVKSDAVLFSHDDVTPGSGDQRTVLNKATAGDTASFLFQTGFSGRAEMGTTGDDDFRFKVSPDGSTWHEAIVVDKDTGAVGFPNTTIGLGAGGLWIDVTTSSYSAVGDGVTDDLDAIQAALDAAGAAGGGIVYLPPGTYLCSNVLAVPSNVHLIGAGFSSVILNPAGALTGKTLSGVIVHCSIAMVGVANTRVSRLTVDHATNASQTNGIQIGESGAAVRSTDCVVEECQVLGAENHQYLIYSKCADRTKIVRNRCVGHSAIPSTDTAGIEVFGGTGVEVASNDVLRCAPGIILQQDPVVPESSLRAIDVHDNRIEAVANGLRVVGINGFSLTDITLHHNVITGAVNRGLFVSVEDGCTVENLLVHGNIVRNSGEYDIAIENASTAVQGLTVSDNVMSNDSIAGVCFYTSGRDMQVFGNMVSGQPSQAYYLNSATNIAFFMNRCAGANGVAVLCDNCTDIAFVNNALTNYGKGGATFGILARTGSSIRFQGNYFKYAVASATAIDARSCTGVEFLDNVVGWVTASSMFIGSTTANETKFGWHPGIQLPAAGFKHVSGAFQQPVAFGASVTAVPDKPVDIMFDNLCMRWPLPPASASATGLTGEIAWDSGYVYVCVATNTWKRAAIATW